MKTDKTDGSYASKGRRMGVKLATAADLKPPYMGHLLKPLSYTKTDFGLFFSRAIDGLILWLE